MEELEYIRAVKRMLRDKFHFQSMPGSTKEEPVLYVPDGTYPMTINGRTDYVRVIDGEIHCCNFQEPAESE